MSERLNKIRAAAYLLPDPGGEVVRELVGEIEKLQSEFDTCAGTLMEWFGKAQDRNGEIRRLRLAISCQKEHLNKQIDDLERLIKRHSYGSHRYVDLTDAREQLIGIRDANYRIAKELKLDESEVSDPVEYTESGVPMLPIPEFCTLYECVAKSRRVNFIGGKHNCIGDETRRLVKNEGGFLTCPTCHYSYGAGE